MPVESRQNQSERWIGSSLSPCSVWAIYSQFSLLGQELPLYCSGGLQFSGTTSLTCNGGFLDCVQQFKKKLRRRDTFLPSLQVSIPQCSMEATSRTKVSRQNGRDSKNGKQTSTHGRKAENGSKKSHDTDGQDGSNTVSKTV